MLDPQIRLATAALASLALASSSGAQVAGSSGGNDLGREIVITAGTQSHAATPCGPVVIFGRGAVFGSKALQTPTSCTMGFMDVSQDIYSCSGAIAGVDCDPFGYQATVMVSRGGGCPTLPDFSDLSPTILSGWATLPAVVLRSRLCTTPQKTAFTDLSARIVLGPADSEAGLVSLEGKTVANSQGRVGVIRSTEWAAAIVGAQGSFNPLLSAFDVAQTGDAGDLPGLLSILAVQQEGLNGVELKAAVRIEHWEAAGLEPSNVFVETLTGNLLADGRFDLDRTFEGASQGDPVSIEHETSFDGQTLRDLPALGELGSVVDLKTGSPNSVHDVYLLAIQPAYDWLADPFWLPMFESGVTTVESSPSPSEYLVQRTYPLVNGGTFVGEQYAIAMRDGQLISVQLTELNVDGSTRALWEYGNYFEVVDGIWRPSAVTFTDYLDSSAGGRRIVTSIQIEQARAISLDDAQLVPMPFSTSRLWQVWK